MRLRVLLEIGFTGAALASCSPDDTVRAGSTGRGGAGSTGGAGSGGSIPGPGGGATTASGANGTTGSTAPSGSAGSGNGSSGGGGAGGSSGGDAGPSSDAGRKPACLEVTETADDVVVSNCVVRITISKRTGTADFAWNDTTRLRGTFASARIPVVIQTRDATKHEMDIAGAGLFEDAFGTGRRVTVNHRATSGPTLRQNYYLYDKLPFAMVDEEVESTVAVASNRLSPFIVDAAGAVDIGTPADGRILMVPFHNDAFTRYDARPIDGVAESYEVTAIYDNQSRAGLVLGSVTHDTWKSAILYGATGGKIATLEAYGGASSPGTQDTLPHGTVTGTTIRSPRIFVGYFADWRDGLETFGRANATLAPNAHPWMGGVIFGFNTWAAYACSVTENAYHAASDFVAKTLTPNGFKGTGAVFLNWDACGAPSAASVGYVKNNGQKAGAYLTPFTAWSANSGPGILKDPNGVPLPQIDGGYPLDPTHPDVEASIRGSIANYKSMGYEYVKLDFMTHGIREGAHHDKNVTTGVQAYNYGLEYIAEAAGGGMFIDLSIAPIFPGGQYAHARRVSCDAFGGIFNSEYLMNNAGYGWWLNGGAYQYNDPDHIVLATSAADGNQLHTLEEARTRVNASAVGGAVFLDSDRLDGDSEAQSRASLLLTNPDVNAIARRGKTFRPVDANTGTQATSVFVSNDGVTHYLAVFNWNTGASATVPVDLQRAGLDPAVTYATRDLWTGARSTAKGALGVTLGKTASTIFELVPRP